MFGFDDIIWKITMMLFDAGVKICEAFFKWLFASIQSVGESLTSTKDTESAITAPKAAKQLTSAKPQGVFFGKQYDDYIIKPEDKDGHVMVVGGSGSGKSSCIAIPTLQNSWNSRVFAIDIKGELYQTTKKQRKNIMVLNPLDSSKFGYNPYYFLTENSNNAQKARIIAEAIIPLLPNAKEPFWVKNAQNIFTGVILHYYHLGYSFIQTIQEFLSMSHADLIQTVFNSQVKEARQCVAAFVKADPKLLGGCMTEISANITTIANDPDLVDCLSRPNIITPLDLEKGNDIYFHIPEHLLRQWRGFSSLVINQFLTYFEQRPEQNTTPILFLLDEFPRLGKIETVLDGLATLRSKKVTICLIIQSLAQLDVIYGTGERKVIADNCLYKAVLLATDPDTQDYFSRLVGTYDKIKTTHTENYEAITGFPKGTGKSTTTEEKRIIKPEEFGTLTQIILFAPSGVYRIDKNPYYEQVS